MNRDLAIVLTARMGSERLPGKAMLEINGQPLIGLIIRRLSRIGNVILATTKQANDDPLAAFGVSMNIPVYRGAYSDVITRMDEAVKLHHPDARWVLRGLGDCPFMSEELIDRALEVCRARHADIMAWALPPHMQPLYGCREFPYSRAAWNRIVENSGAREHVDVYYHSNRALFDVVYHEPPKNVYFRPYRVEVDWPEDIAMLRALAKHVSLLAGLERLVQIMDKHPEVTKLNRERVERTGPSTYSYQVHRSWYENMCGKKIVGWDDTEWQNTVDGEPIFCDGGTCLIGFAHGGEIQTRAGDLVRGNARLACACGIGKRWLAAS